MLTQVFVQEKNYTQVAKFILIDVKLLLNMGAEITYSVCAENGKTIKTDVYTLTPEQFANWGTDDTYVVDLICEREGLTLA